MIALGWLLREPTTINYPFEKGPLSPVRILVIFSWKLKYFFIEISW
jgi:hypothetical protein